MEKTKAAPIATDAVVKIVDKDFTFGSEGTKRAQSWAALKSQRGKKTVAKYLENGGARKYLARWAKAGAIEIAA
tara:strand:- start:172 stop:393 length:222 start_codon:yes stop_codon:yes gene_type:complete